MSELRKAQVHSADSASGQAAHGMSGKAPTPYQAWYSPLTARRRCGDARAYGRRPELVSPRNTDTPSVHLGGGRRNGSGCHLALASLPFARSRVAFALDCGRRTLTGSLARSVPSIHASSASGCSLHAHLSGTMSHIGGNVAPTAPQPSVAAIGICSCNPPSTILMLHGQPDTQSRSIHNASRSLP
jgi:hypothetical protein